MCGSSQLIRLCKNSLNFIFYWLTHTFSILCCCCGRQFSSSYVPLRYCTPAPNVVIVNFHCHCMFGIFFQLNTMVVLATGCPPVLVVVGDDGVLPHQTISLEGENERMEVLIEQTLRDILDVLVKKLCCNIRWKFISMQWNIHCDDIHTPNSTITVKSIFKLMVKPIKRLSAAVMNKFSHELYI